MKIYFIVLGTRGDLQASLALAAGLQASGHSVRIAAAPGYESLVRGNGMDFAAIGLDARPLLESQEFRPSLRRLRGPLSLAVASRRASLVNARNKLEDCWRGCQGADVVLASILGVVPGYSIAEKLGVPLVGAFPFPMTSTSAYPAFFLRPDLRLGRWFNRSTHRLAEFALSLLFRAQSNAARRDVLGLPALPPRPVEQLNRKGWLNLYGYSALVCPPPPDWGDSIKVTGYWRTSSPDGGSEWRPPEKLARFLASGPPPVCVGFGSMSDGRAETLTPLVIDALARAGQRGVLLTGWGGLDGSDPPEHVCVVDEVPHDWLYPRMAAAVHHGGAGTTGASLRAGIPTIIVSFWVPDQRFWGQRVYDLGVGPRSMQHKQLTVEGLADAIRVATSDEGMRRRAAALGARLRQEDGVRLAVDAFNAYFSRSS